MKKESQTQRILDALLAVPVGMEVPSVQLHRVGSGKYRGWVNSLSRRISDCRKIVWEKYGMTIPAPRKVTARDGTVFTFYKLSAASDPLAQGHVATGSIKNEELAAV